MATLRVSQRIAALLMAIANQPLSAGSLYAQGVCPLMPLGVSLVNSTGEEVFFATASAPLLGSDGVALGLAEGEARIAARATLTAEKRMPIRKDGSLSGVKDEGTCSSNGRVYATVSVSKNSFKKADALKDMVRDSLARTPSPQPESYFWKEGEPYPPLVGPK